MGPDRPLAPGDPLLLVGGTGLVGRALARAAAEQSLLPLVVSRTPPPAGLLPPQARHLACDAQDLPDLLAAGRLPSLGSPGAPLGVVHVPARDDRELRPLLQALAGRPGRLVALSSAAVFGHATPGRLHAAHDPPAPATAAMRGKVALERLLGDAHAAGSGTLALRLAYPYGPGHGPLTPLGRDRALFGRLQRGECVTWVLPGALAPLQPLWVEDLAGAILALLCHDGRPAPLYHAAGPQILSWDAYLDALARAVAAPPPRIRALTVKELLAGAAPGAVQIRWLAEYLRDSPLLDDRRLRTEVYPCATRLADAAPLWAAWCLSGDG